MGVYTTEQKIRALLEAGGDYNRAISLTQFVETADILVADVVSNQVSKSLPELESLKLVKIATWLGAHLYQQADKGYTRRRTGSKEGYFQIEVGKGLDSTLYGQTAKLLDTSGYLATLDKPGEVEIQALWLGKRPSEQTPVRERS